MNNIYAKNMEFIKSMNEDLYNKIDKTNLDTVTCHNTSSGERNISKKLGQKTFFIHSNYNLQRQEEYICEYILSEQSDIVFLFGLGLGYEFKQMIKKDSNKRYFIVEPDIEIFKVLLMHEDISFLFNNRNVYFILSKSVDAIGNFLGKLVSNDRRLRIKFFSLTAYESIYAEISKELYEKVKNMMQNYKVNVNTAVYSQRAWFQAYISNLKYLKDTCPISKLQNRFNNVPAIMVAAGPSITENIEWLKKVQDKALIAAVGSGISVAENNDIKVDMFGAVDTWDTENRLTENLILNKNKPILYSTAVNLKLLNKFNKNKFLMTVSGMDSYVAKKLNWKRFGLYSGASIANTVAYNLSKLGCNPIIFLGQDLCFSMGKTHAESAKYYREISEEEIAQSKGYIKVKNKNDEDVYTDVTFLTSVTSFEFCAKLHPQIEYLNGSNHGLDMEGIENIDFNKYVEEELSSRDDVEIEKLLDETYEEHLKLQDSNEIDNLLCEIKEDILKIKELCRKIIMCAESDGRLENKKTEIAELEKEIINMNFYKEVMEIEVNHMMYIYEQFNYVESKRRMYSYLLDKVLFMENAYQYQINGGKRLDSNE